MRRYLGTTEEEIKSKKHNIWLGVSLGNKYFTKDNLREYILYSLKYTREKVLVIIADRIHAINVEVLDGKNKGRAERIVMRLGEKKFNEIKEILEELQPKDATKIQLVRWDEIVDEEYKKRLEIIKYEYIHNEEFKSYLLNIVKSGKSNKTEKLNKLDDIKMDRLAEYVMEELPLLVDGVTIDDVIYTALAYPGTSLVDDLSVSINNKTLFKDLGDKLDIKHNFSKIDISL